MKGLSVHVSKLLVAWFWRLDASMGGDAEPHRGQQFVAAHPVRFGLIVGAATGGFLALFGMFGAATGWEYAFAPSTLLFCLCVAAFAGASMMGIGYFGRWRQRHYGHYPREVQGEPGSRG